METRRELNNKDMIRFEALLENEEYETLFKEFPECEKIIKNSLGYIGYIWRKTFEDLKHDMLEALEPLINKLRQFLKMK